MKITAPLFSKYSRFLMIAIIEAVLVIALSVMVLRLYRYDLTVPLHYSGDAIFFLALIKGMILNGWTYNIPQLSAPFALDVASYSYMTNLDWSMMKIISLITSEPGSTVNLYWLLSIVFTAWTASLSLYLITGNGWFSILSGIVYAFLPFAILRNTGHIALVFSWVPLICLLAIHIAEGKPNGKNDAVVRGLGYLGCVLQGFSYLYFSFFAVLLFGCSGAIAFVQNRSLRSLKIAFFSVVVIVVTMIVNMSPTLYSWYQFGKPPGMDFKMLSDAELYGLKIRTLLAPQADNPIPFLSYWAKRNAVGAFPNENENRTARLGTFTSFGFLLLLGFLILPTDVRTNEYIKIRRVAALGLFTLLISTVGGLGAVINVLTVPDIRCYNRFSVFLAFFSLAVLGIWFSDRLLRTNRPASKKVLIGIITILGLLSLYDQLLDAKPLRERQAFDLACAYHEREMVQLMEKNFPFGAMIFQLPLAGFPSAEIFDRMISYDHARPYLWSSHLRWSWPHFSEASSAWRNKIEVLHGNNLVTALALSGFDGVWVDRYAYKDNGQVVISDLEDGGAREVLSGMSQRYAILDLQSIRTNLVKQLGKEGSDAAADQFFHPTIVKWGKGFYASEKTLAGQHFRWSMNRSSIFVSNPSEQWRKVRMNFLIQSEGTGKIDISLAGQNIEVNCSTISSNVFLDFELKPREVAEIAFVGRVPMVVAPKDPRELYFAIIDPKVSDSIVEKQAAPHS